ncbi:MAG: TonB-dependent receptor [Myxococcales bacterium]
MGLALLTWSLAALAQAQEAGEELGATATVQRPLAATNDEDPTASGSTVELLDRSRALEEVAEAVVEVPGLRVQDTGGAGGFAGVSLRGAEVGHTVVRLGAIPLNTPDSGAFDLSVLPARAFERVEVYRGGAPAWHGDGAIGGTVRFVPARGRRSSVQATAGAGAFGRRELRASSSVTGRGARDADLFTHLRVLSADNDYPYDDDGGTGFIRSDDRVLRQRNADILATDGLMHAGVDALGGRVSVLLAGHGREQGVPGPLVSPTARVRRKLVRGLAGLAYEREALAPNGQRRHRLQLVASGSQQLNALTDMYAGGELGLAQPVASHDLWQRATLRAAGSVAALPFLEPTLVLSARADAYRPENRVPGGVPQRDSDRLTIAAVLEPRLHGRLLGMRAELRPSVGLALSQTSIGARSDAQSRDDFVPTYRVAAAIEPWTPLTLSASVASGKRLPSISELFGDRVYQEPNPSLSPERSTAVDGGAVLRGRFGGLRGVVEARGFALFVDDLIRFERTAQYTVRPDNVASARMLGIELGASGELGRHFGLRTATTLMDTENQFGRDLPLRPELQVLVRPELRLYPARRARVMAFAEAHHVSFVYLDDKNLADLPGRTLFDLGAAASLWGERVELRVQVKNLFGARVSDLLSRPLPGRDVRVSVTWREDLVPK